MAGRWSQVEIASSGEVSQLRELRTRPDEPSEEYDAFLSTLASVMGTLLALLLGFAGGYYIFLREHQSQLNGHSQESKFEICDALKALRKAWSGNGKWREVGVPGSEITMPPWFYSFTDPELERIVREAHPNTPDAEIGKRLAIELVYGGTSDPWSLPPEVVRAAQFQHPTLPWRGRLYYWLIARSVDEITLTSHRRKAPVDIFPADPTAPGFESWSRVYAQVRQEIEELSDSRKELEDDYFEFTAKVPEAMPASALDPMFRGNLVALDAALPQIDRHLDLISKDALQLENYSTTSLTRASLLLKIGIAFLAGVVAPLVVLLLGTMRRAQFLFAGMLALSLGAFLSATWQLSEIISGRHNEAAAYRRSRWYRVLADDMNGQEEGLNRIGRLDVTLFDAAARSDDVGLFDADVVRALRSVVKTSGVLTASTERLNSCVLVGLQADFAMGKVNIPGGVGVSPPELADEESYDTWRRQFLGSAPGAVSVRRFGPSGVTYDAGFIRLPPKGAARAALLARFDDFHHDVETSPEGAQFLAARRDLLAALNNLRVALRRSRGQGRGGSMSEPHR